MRGFAASNSPSPAKIRPEFLALRGQLEQVKQLAVLSERRASDLEARLREQEGINRDMMEYLNTTASVHMIQTPSRSFAVPPFTPQTGARTPDFAQRMSERETSDVGYRDFYETPVKRGTGVGTPERRPHAAGAHPPLPGSVSPGLSPIVKQRVAPSSGSKIALPPSSGHTKGVAMIGGQHGTGSPSRDLPPDPLPMPPLADGDAGREPSRSDSAGSMPHGSDDGSEDLPAYGFAVQESPGAAVTAFTPPRSAKPLVPAPRSHSRHEAEGDWAEGMPYPRLEFGPDHSLSGTEISEELSQGGLAAARGPGTALATPDTGNSEDYSDGFDDDDDGASRENNVTEKRSIVSHSHRSVEVPDGANESSLQLISMLDLSSGTMRSAMSAANTTAASASAGVVVVQRTEVAVPPPLLRELENRDAEPSPSPTDASLSFSLSSSNVLAGPSTAVAAEQTGSTTDPSVQQNSAPVGIAFGSPGTKPAMSSWSGSKTSERDSHSSSKKSESGDVHTGGSGDSDDDPNIREAMMTESLDIEWTFVKSPLERQENFSPPVAKSVTLHETPSLAATAQSSPFSHSKAASRYNTAGHSSDSDTSPHHNGKVVPTGSNRESDERSAHVAFSNVRDTQGPPRSNRKKSTDFRESTHSNHGDGRPHRKSHSSRRGDSDFNHLKYSSRHQPRRRLSSRDRARSDHRKRQSWPSHTRPTRRYRSLSPPRYSDYYWNSIMPQPYSMPPPFSFPFYPPPFLPPVMPAYMPGCLDYRGDMKYPKRAVSPRRRHKYSDDHDSDVVEVRSISDSISCSSDLASEASDSSCSSGSVVSAGEGPVGSADLHRKHSLRRRSRRRHRHRSKRPSPSSSEEFFHSPEVVRAEYASTFPPRQSFSRRTSPPRYRESFRDVETASSTTYHIPPPIHSPSFRALDSNRHIRLNVGGRYDRTASLQSLVSTFKKTYESYKSPLSAGGASDLWRRKVTYRPES